jgi:hypothetical protein
VHLSLTGLAASDELMSRLHVYVDPHTIRIARVHVLLGLFDTYATARDVIAYPFEVRHLFANEFVYIISLGIVTK